MCGAGPNAANKPASGKANERLHGLNMPQTRSTGIIFTMAPER